MADAARVNGDMYVTGNLTVGGSQTVPSGITNTNIASNAAIARTKLAQDTSQLYMIPWTFWRVWNAYQTNLPGTSAADDLGLYDGTFGTGSPSIKSYDVKAAGAVTLYARAVFALPAEYDDAETVAIRAHAGMLTTVADTSATLDFMAYESDKESGISADLVATAAQDINNLVLDDYDFSVTATSLVAGDVLDIRMAMAINDGATVTAVQGIVGWCGLLLDIRG